MAQHFAMEPMIAFTRFGKWNDVLALPEPDEGLIYMQVVYRFAKGMAQVRTGNIGLAEVQLKKLDSLSKLDTLKNLYATLNPVSKISEVAVDLLRGEVLIKKNRVDEGVEALTRVVKTEDSFRYNEPQDWKIPTRHFLGGALLQIGRYREAEVVFLEDLRRNPQNGWSLYGLHQSQLRQGRKPDAARTAAQFKEVWKHADVKLNSSRF